MALYDRLIGLDDAGQPVEGKIPVHQFQALMAEFARGIITGAEAQEAITFMTGTPLDPAGVTEVQQLIATVTGSAATRLARVKVIDDVLMLAEVQIPNYDRPADVKARLGV